MHVLAFERIVRRRKPGRRPRSPSPFVLRDCQEDQESVIGPVIGPSRFDTDFTIAGVCCVGFGSNNSLHD